MKRGALLGLQSFLLDGEGGESVGQTVQSSGCPRERGLQCGASQRQRETGKKEEEAAREGGFFLQGVRAQHTHLMLFVVVLLCVCVLCVCVCSNKSSQREREAQRLFPGLGGDSICSCTAAPLRLAAGCAAATAEALRALCCSAGALFSSACALLP